MPAIKTPKLKKKAPALSFDAVIFDIDNVLIDTRRSYLDTIRWCVDIYLTSGTIPLFSPPSGRRGPFLLSSRDVDDFKLLGGFNDDWDCCYGLLVYLLTLPVKKRTLPELKRAMNIQKFSASVKRRPLGAAGIVKMLGRPSSVMIEKIARIFQEIYLGKELFEATEGKKALYWKKRGLIFRERPVFKKQLLLRLKKMGLEMGIATGRSRFEADYALKRFGITDLFTAVTPIDEVKKAEQLMKQSLRKPHPFSVLETAKKMGLHKRFLYLGDLPDDALAANQAKSRIRIHSAIFPSLTAASSSAASEIQKASPDFIIKDPRQLITLVKSR